jgi:type III secretion protein J
MTQPDHTKRAGAWAWLLLLVFVAGCSVPIASDLGDNDSNRVMVALERAGVAAQKEPDPNADGKWRVTVARDDAAAAVGVLTEDNLPPPSAPGVLQALGKGSIVPSRTAEHAKLVAGTEGDLERSLLAVDGVLSARVHLAVPTESPFGQDEKPQPPTASVLIRHRGATPPIASADVARLVAGGVPGLEPARVSVVMTAVPEPPRRPSRSLSRFGPITVTRSSMLALRLVVGAAVLMNLLLLGLLAALWARMRRATLTLAELRASSELSRQDPR